jgi:hypothetical protein
MTNGTVRTRPRSSGQTLAEMGVILPVLLILMFGMLELGWALFQSNVIRGYVRESSNLISRNVEISEAEAAIISASNSGGPVLIDPASADSRMIISVVTLGAAGGPNAGVPIILKRHFVGTMAANSVLGNPSQGNYGGANVDYIANNANSTSIRVTGALPNGYTLPVGQSLYVTEIFTRRGTIVNLGLAPQTLYAAAFF